MKRRCRFCGEEFQTHDLQDGGPRCYVSPTGKHQLVADLLGLDEFYTFVIPDDNELRLGNGAFAGYFPGFIDNFSDYNFPLCEKFVYKINEAPNPMEVEAKGIPVVASFQSDSRGIEMEDGKLIVRFPRDPDDWQKLKKAYSWQSVKKKYDKLKNHNSSQGCLLLIITGVLTIISPVLKNS
jgi:hypothetical protein